MRVLLVEDDPGVRETLADLLEAAGHAVTIAPGYAEAAALLPRVRCDVLLSDLVMPGGSGLTLAELARARGIGAVVCSGHPTRIDQLPADGGIVLLVKPFSMESLESALARAAGQGG